MHRIASNLAPYALTAVLLAVGAPAARAGGTYTVDRFDDVLGADQCFDAVADDCSLRGAIRRSNLDGVDTIIILPDGLYQLTLEAGDVVAVCSGSELPASGQWHHLAVQGDRHHFSSFDR